MDRVKHVAVVGGGTAGLMAALALKMVLPGLAVDVIRSPEIGIIGVGEGSTPPFTRFIHEFLKVPVAEFVRATCPGIKIGTCFMWGPRPRFFFPFGQHLSLRLPSLSRPIGYYMNHSDSEAASPRSARMKINRAFAFSSQGSLTIDGEFAYHLENERFAAFLESVARARGIQIIDGTIENVRQGEQGVAALDLADGRSISADLYVDSSGFRSLLLGKTLGEPRVDYKQTLACDRAVVGGWARPTGLPMVGCTISETMDSGWCWKIDHPDRINRGYVYSSAFISDDQAETELRMKNPQIGPTRVVKFVSGRSVRSWVKNVVAIGNASGFVEPLESTSLAVSASRSMLLVRLLQDCNGVIKDPLRQLFNQSTAGIWDSIRDFLSLHYRFNTRLNTPFWQHCREKTDLCNAAGVIDYYQQIGPSPELAAPFVDRGAEFGVDSYFAILTGQNVPTDTAYRPSPAELLAWDQWCRDNTRAAQSAATVEESLYIIAGGNQLN